MYFRDDLAGEAAGLGHDLGVGGSERAEDEQFNPHDKGTEGENPAGAKADSAPLRNGRLVERIVLWRRESSARNHPDS